MESLRQLPSTMQNMQQTITEKASSISNTVIKFTQNTMLPLMQNIWSAVRDIFSSFRSIVESNPKTAIGIAASVVTAVTLSLAFLLLRKEKVAPKISL
jgi:predicted PurR-regulated permease PerM